MVFPPRVQEPNLEGDMESVAKLLNHFEGIFMSLTCFDDKNARNIVTSFYTSMGSQIMMAPGSSPAWRMLIWISVGISDITKWWHKTIWGKVIYPTSTKLIDGDS